MAESGILSTILSESRVRALAGATYYQRGVDYFRRNRVSELQHGGDVLEAVVSGTEDYEVRIAADGNRFDYTCDCPLGDEGAFCKHCVATALAWLADSATNPTPSARPKPPRPRRITDRDIAAALNAAGKETLVGWLVEWSQQNPALRQHLTTIARAHVDPASIVSGVRQQLQDAIRVRGYIDYKGAGGYAGRVGSALDDLEALLRQGHGAAAIDLCESAMKWLEAAIQNVDDSNGEGGELMGRIAALHLKACEQARPDPESLGVRLLALQVNAEFGQWCGVAAQYAHLLGEPGIAAFRAAADKIWACVPVRTVADRHNRDTAGPSHYSITRIMESLARQSGDVEQLVAVLERDLTTANRYRQIAGAYREAGQHDKALDWAERGMALFPSSDGSGLRRFVAEEYRRNERHADALRILWSEFRAAPSLEHYKQLEEFARAADDWDDWRDRALAHIRRKPANQHARDNSLLVTIFLYEQRINEAWQEAQSGGCYDHLWLELAAHREKTHPGDAAGVFLRIGEATITAEDGGRYGPGIALLEKAAALMQSLGRGAEFESRFDALRLRLKAKRNLQKLAEERRKFLYR